MICLISHWNDRTDSVRLYRRGYETVVIPADRLYKAIGDWAPVEVTWKKADTLIAGERAIDYLHGTLSGMQITSRKKNVFIAAEYAELAESKIAAETDLAPQRLRRMAEKFTEGIPPDEMFREAYDGRAI